MEARSQLRHRPTWCGGQLLSFNSRLASPPRQTRLAWSASNRIWLAKHKGHNRSPMSNSRNILVRSLFCFIFIAGLAAALAPAAGAQEAAGAQPPVAYASVRELNSILEQLKQTSQSMQSNLARARIERWKTDGATKRQTLANVESIQ